MGEVSRLTGPGEQSTDLANDFLSMARQQIEAEERFLVPELRRRDEPAWNTWSYQNRVLDFHIEDGDRVLDIGSGGWPFSKATCIADRFLDETTHRVEEFQRDGRPVIKLDVQRLPFGTKSWDFVMCSHVLEHVDRPGDACRELMRVARRGYVELPTRLSDVIFNFTKIEQHHRWHGLVLGRTLTFIEWAEEERVDLGTNQFFQCAHSAYENPFQEMLESNWGMFFATFPWEGSFNFVVIDKEGAVIDRS
jgi:SAM-dependent methyltransferase